MLFSKKIVFVLFLGISLGNASVTSSWMKENILNNCSRNLRPNNGGPPVEVGVSMYILDISSISEEKMEYQVDLLFRQYWKDKCLIQDGIPKISNDVPRWIPDTFFVNEKNTYKRAASPSSEFLRVDEGGDIIYSKRITLTASCHYDLQNFPMDKQTCQLDIESYGHTVEDIKYYWKFDDKSVGISSDIMLPQFQLLRHKLKQTETESPAIYSRLTVEFQFKRFIGHYAMQVFLPSITIVLISFASMWINSAFTTVRISLSSIAFLTMAILQSNVNATFPKVSYTTAVDVYLLVCLIMASCSVLEGILTSCVVKTTQTKIKLLSKIMKINNKNDLNNTSSNKIDEPNQYSLMEELHDKDGNMIPNMTDVYSRFLFPIIFSIFNIIFWIYYSSFSWK